MQGVGCILHGHDHARDRGLEFGDGGVDGGAPARRFVAGSVLEHGDRRGEVEADRLDEQFGGARGAPWRQPEMARQIFGRRLDDEVAAEQPRSRRHADSVFLLAERAARFEICRSEIAREQEREMRRFDRADRVGIGLEDVPHGGHLQFTRDEIVDRREHSRPNHRPEAGKLRDGLAVEVVEREPYIGVGRQVELHGEPVPAGAHARPPPPFNHCRVKEC
jgi:hypothetical protein